jgi:hypothetical protein
MPEASRSSSTLDGLLPSNSTQYNFACSCSNLQVYGRISANSEDNGVATESAAASSGSKKQVWLGEGAELAVG